MSKKYKTTTTLVIVESPAKCKKIEEYLGPGYKCMATFGHLRELKSLDNIDFENGFKLKFTDVDNQIKRKQIELLKSEIKKADDVILATDDDREGEGISWHICDMFGLDLKKTKRIIFNEITETALQNAIKNPKHLNMDIVRAQQTRQILDLMVGFKFSPLLWKYISKNSEQGLSAGRCQTPALKLVYENQKEINANPGEKVYSVTGYFTNNVIAFELNKDYKSEDDVTDFLDGSINFSHIYSCSEPKKSIKKSPEPFTTSRIQQVASNELHYSPKETMKLCQTLYEGGYITYMRTDSKKYSKEFVEDAIQFIARGYGTTYVKPNTMEELTNNALDEANVGAENKKKKGKKEEDTLAQNAHEAIRPTNISLENLPEEIGSKEKRMYKLIRENTIESCMSDAIFLSITAQIKGVMDTIFKYNSEKCEFKGWKIVANKCEDDKYYQYLLTLKKGTVLQYKKMCAKVNMRNLKQHYTEARLVQLLEENGIGRPSTFSSLVDKIQERGYVKKDNISGKEMMCKDYELEDDTIYEIEVKREFGNEKNKLIIQNLGELVMDFLDSNFNSIFNYEYTREMETTLDKIAKKQIEWNDCCSKYLKQIEELINDIEDEIKKVEIKIDDNHYYMMGKHGPVVKFVDPVNKDEKGNQQVFFKTVKKNIDMDKLKNGKYKLEEIIDENKSGKDVPIGKYEGKDLYVKKGKYGLYATWGSETKSLKCFGNRPIENIEYTELVKILNDYKKYKSDNSSGSDSDNSKNGKAKNPNTVREVSRNISIRKGKGNDYIFYKTKEMTQPKFFKLNDFKEDYKTCDKKVLKSWIKEKYDIN